MIEPSNVYIKKVKKLEGAQDCFLVEPLQFVFSCTMDTFKRGLALPRCYKILTGQVHV